MKTKLIHCWSAYETREPWINKTKTKLFIYPVVYSIKVCDTPTFYWSSRNDRGHFGIPKVIWGNGSSGIIVDQEGKYGLSQFASAIVDDPENLEDIAKAMRSQKFIDLMKAASFINNRYPYRVIAELRHDFWKEFL